MDKTLRVAVGLACLAACHSLAIPPAKSAAASPTSMRAVTVFTDSAIYRARCKEADTLVSLTVIPRKCTPRDQRLEIR
jgi:hypothetical protein